MVAPHKPQALSENGKIYTQMVINEEMALNESMEEAFKGDSCESLKNKTESKASANNYRSTSSMLNTNLRQYLSDM